MKIRLFDRFDTNFTVATYDDVECVVNNTIIFIDGDEMEIDSEFYDWEEIK